MEGFLSVDPAQLRQAMSESHRATAGLEDAKTKLDWSNGNLADGVGGTKVADRFDGFRKRWRDEFGIISEFLSGMEKSLQATADIYEAVERDLTQAMGRPPSG